MSSLEMMRKYHTLTKSYETPGLQVVQAAPDSSDGTQTDVDKDEMETDDDRGKLRQEIWWLCTLACPAVPTAMPSQMKSGSAHWDLELAVEVRECPLGSGARGSGPAVPTAMWPLQMRSGSAHWDLELAIEVGSAHCDLELAVEVQQCPLRSGAGEEAAEVAVGLAGLSGGRAMQPL
eukprot:s724_g8.t1